MQTVLTGTDLALKDGSTSVKRVQAWESVGVADLL